MAGADQLQRDFITVDVYDDNFVGIVRRKKEWRSQYIQVGRILSLVYILFFLISCGAGDVTSFALAGVGIFLNLATLCWLENSRYASKPKILFIGFLHVFILGTLVALECFRFLG
ncbi:hypothetical protein Sjap_019569 [Stephania japonica]|uniref:Uncharacterized protein n=1 Tax=Stephania japonica TaxID=461633 RepID=A0AAP0HZM1_9MAGN